MPETNQCGCITKETAGTAQTFSTPATETDPDERNNLIRHPDYADKLLPLRKALYQSLYPADNDKPAVPFNARLSEGLNLRKKGGLKAAPFPDWWKVEPNRPDKFNGLFPDTPLKINKVKNGEAYFPFMEKSDKKQ